MLLLRIAADIGERQDDDRKARRGGFFGRWGRRGPRVGGLADLKRIDPDRLGDVLELGWAEVGDLEIEPPLDLPVGLLGEADRPRLGDAFQPRGDIDAVAHQVAVAFLDHVAEMDADPKFDALVRRDPSVALDHRPLDFNGAVHRVDDTPELDNCAIASALDDTAVMHARSSGSIRSLRSARSRDKRPILIGPGKPRIADDVGDQDRREFSSFRPRRYAAATVSAVSGRPGKASGARRKDAKGISASLGLVMALSVSHLGQGQAREAGTEKSDVSGANLSRAKGQLGVMLGRWQVKVEHTVRRPQMPQRPLPMSAARARRCRYRHRRRAAVLEG